MIFTKTLFSSAKKFFFSNGVIHLKNIFVSPFKKFIPVKESSLYKKIYSVRHTHSVKDEFYFQFSFAINK